MKATILHESNGRIRFRPSIKKMTLQDADILEAWFTQQPWCEDVKVHERTGTVTLYYQGPLKIYSLPFPVFHCVTCR